MHAFSIFSLVALGALTTAIPHGGHLHKHANLARSPIPAPALEVRDLGACGGDAGSCPDGYCCSQYGYCGKSAAYCGNGCQSAFGTCNANASPSEDSTAATSVELQNNGKSFDPPQSYGSGGESWGAATTTTTLAASTSAAPTSTSEAAPSSYSAPAATSSAPSTDGSSGSDSGSDSYTVYTGDGSTGAGWPSEDQWVDFESMWSANMAYISISCAQFGMADNSDSESEHLKTAIQDVASASGVDARFVLAVTMQESKGCVRAPTTAYSHANPGLMQSHDGTGSCNGAGGVQDPCPQDEITQQIQDGTEGTSAGDGLKQLLAQAGGSGAETYYKAARMYNSGSVDASGDLGKGVATHCYASDIANRLTGWVTATTTCNL